MIPVLQWLVFVGLVIVFVLFTINNGVWTVRYFRMTPRPPTQSQIRQCYPEYKKRLLILGIAFAVLFALMGILDGYHGPFSFMESC